MDKLFSHDKPAGAGKGDSGGDHHHQRPSNSELFSSAKLLAGATQSAFRGQSDKVDKGKAAGAAADLLDAASDYGKLKEKSFGKYVDKAGDYLHQYESKNSAHAPSHDSHAPSHGAHAPSSHEHGAGDGHGDEKKQSKGGMGDYLKMAQGFLQK